MDFVCPETRVPLRALSEEEVAALRAELDAGKAQRADGTPVGEFEGAFGDEAGTRAYLVAGGIPNFLVGEHVLRGAS